MRVNLSGAIGELTTLPGCSQVVVSHGVFVPPKSRGNGIGKQGQLKRLRLMEELGYDYALCTVESTNDAQIHILTSNGWKKLSSFKSSKTGHKVYIFGRNI